MEGLAHELLDLSRPGYNELVVLRKLVHTQNGDDILKTLVILQELLCGSGDRVVLLADDASVEHARRGVERVDSRVDTKLGNGAGQHGRGVKMGKGGGWSRIGKIVSGHVDGLHGCDGSLRSGGNTLLQPSHIGSEGGLVPDGRRDTAEQGRHLRTSLGEAEDIVDEKKDVLSLLVTEVLGDGESRQGNAGAGARRLVHLSVHKSGLAALGGPTGLIDLDDTSLNHLVVKIVSFTRALADSGEDRVSTVVHGDVVNELHDNDGLSDTGTSEESDLTALGVRREEIDDLDSGDENLLRLTLLGEGWRRPVEGGELLLALGEDGSLLVDGFADDIDDPA
mmetsp:Transcript_32263/g.73162  ORF Transcript_32263/g.73162 Transcript_32263/m.73162 type:complete len:337 (-) Transcript_32263:274-1284(-)